MALGAADILSFIPDEATAMNVPYFFIGTGAGVRLQVEEEYVSAARQIINNAREVRVEDIPEEQVRDEDKNNEDEEEQRV